MERIAFFASCGAGQRDLRARTPRDLGAERLRLSLISRRQALVARLGGHLPEEPRLLGVGGELARTGASVRARAARSCTTAWAFRVSSQKLACAISASIGGEAGFLGREVKDGSGGRRAAARRRPCRASARRASSATTSARVQRPRSPPPRPSTSLRAASPRSACTPSCACRSGTVASSTPGRPAAAAPRSAPVGATNAEMPVLAARAIATRFSTARNGSIARCCHGPLVSPNHASFVMLAMNARAAGHELPEQLGKDAPRSRSPPRTALRRSGKTVRRSPGAKSEMNSAQLRTKPISRASGTYSPNGTR